MRWPFRFYDRLGIEFPYHGETLIWIWPWKRKYGKYVSFWATSNGELGDAHFNSLRDVRQYWIGYDRELAAKLANEFKRNLPARAK